MGNMMLKFHNDSSNFAQGRAPVEHTDAAETNEELVASC
jgi:hypothetical protein